MISGRYGEACPLEACSSEMKQLIRKCIAWSVLLLITLQAAACSGPVFPSRGLVVNLSPDGPSALEVKDFVYATLAPRGFADGGIDGRDAITGKRAAYYRKRGAVAAFHPERRRASRRPSSAVP